jgi:hypothetical protein
MATTKPQTIDAGAAKFMQDALGEAAHRVFVAERISVLLRKLAMDKHAEMIQTTQVEASLQELTGLYATCALLVMLQNRAR